MTARDPANTIVLIPARLASSRLPDKPLADINGLPMIVQVWKRALEADIGRVAVAAGDQAIADAIAEHGGEAVMTDPDLPSGSDRITAVLAEIDPDRRYQRVVNLQGDLPTIDPSLLKAVLRPLDLLGTDIATLAVATTDPAERDDPSVVKAIIAFTSNSDPSGAGLQIDGPARRRTWTRPLLHTGDGACRGLGPSTITSASTPISALPWNVSRPCRRALSSGANAWSSCARWSMA